VQARRKKGVGENTIRVIVDIGPAAAPILIKTLEAEADEVVQGWLASALGKIASKSQDVVATLKEILNDKSPLLRSGVARSFGETTLPRQQVVPILLKSLNDKDPRVRAGTVEALGSFLSANSARGRGPETGGAVGESNSSTEGLEEAQIPQVLKNALDIVSPPYRKTRKVVVDTPEARATIAAIAELITNESNPTVQRKSVRALAAIGRIASATVPLLAGLLKAKDRSARLEVIEAIGRVGGQRPAAISAFLEVLRNDDDPVIRQYALWNLDEGCPDSKANIAVFVACLKDQAVLVRATAAKILGDKGPKAKAAVPALIEALKDREISVRLITAEALGDIGPEAKIAVAALVERLKDRQDGRHFVAVVALGKIGPGAKAAVSALVEIVKDKNDNELVRWRAAQTLGKIGAAAKAALPALIAVRTDNSNPKLVRMGVREALKKIQQ
jgi:HEAT repeat protein